MIKITAKISLQPIKISDCEVLFSLMNEIYTPAYQHFWEDKGSWYLKSQYSKENIQQELKEHDSAYYFVLYEDEIVGNFRIIWNEKLEGLAVEKQVKLHRVYLHPKTLRKGIGKELLSWLEEKAIKKEYKIIWLDAMNEQPQAFDFYKKLGYKYHSHCFLDFKLLYNEVRKMSQLYKNI